MLKKVWSLVLVILAFFASVLLYSPFLLQPSQAASLGDTYFFLERLEVDTSNIGAVVLVKPKTSFVGVLVPKLLLLSRVLPTLLQVEIGLLMLAYLVLWLVHVNRVLATTILKLQA